MENKKIGTMRMVAGSLYAIYAFYQTWLFNLYFEKATFTGIRMIAQAEILLALAMAAFAIYLLAGKKAPNEYIQRGAIAATAIITIFELITFTAQKVVLEEVFAMSESLNTNIAHIILIFVRIVLLIVATFFVLTPAQMEKDAVEELDENETQLIEAEISEEEKANTETNPE